MIPTPSLALCSMRNPIRHRCGINRFSSNKHIVPRVMSHHAPLGEIDPAGCSRTCASCPPRNANASVADGMHALLGRAASTLAILCSCALLTAGPADAESLSYSFKASPNPEIRAAQQTMVEVWGECEAAGWSPFLVDLGLDAADPVLASGFASCPGDYSSIMLGLQSHVRMCHNIISTASCLANGCHPLTCTAMQVSAVLIFPCSPVSTVPWSTVNAMLYPD